MSMDLLMETKHSPNDSFYLRPLQVVSSGSNRYRNLAFVGSGGNGTTFKVVCEKGEYCGVEFALKVFYRVSDQERRRRFLNEAKVLQRLNHPGIIKLFDQGVYTTKRESYPFMLVEYIPNSMRDILVGPDRPPLQTIRFALQVLSALDNIHTSKNPIVHRDIKPENILIFGDVAKLADFGLFREILSGTDDEQPVSPTTKPAMPIRYRTPDLIKAYLEKIPPTVASDIYQFGLVLYEMCTGWNPQKQVQNVLDPIEISPLRPINWRRGADIVQLVTEMIDEEPVNRPTAAQCISRLMDIYLELQQSHIDLFNTTA